MASAQQVLSSNPNLVLSYGFNNSNNKSRYGKRLCSIKCQEQQSKKSNSSANRPQSGLDRRQFVLSTSLGLAAGSLQQQQKSFAAPVELGDVTACTLSDTGGGSLNCCPPASSSPIVDFVYNTQLPNRQRPAAHLVTSDYIAKYNRAYQLMRALPADDPRNFSQQANVHCAYCNDGFTQANSTALLQIHNSWLFFPWHRWYLYFHERILGSLIGDDTFALPFWNWDNQSSSTPLPNVIPQMYLNNPALYDALRDEDHLPNRLVDLNFDGVDPATPPTNSAQRAENNAVMYQQIVSGARTASLFLGQAYRAGDQNTPGGGLPENAPHGPVHVWTGSSDQPNGEDMGTFYSAARDPIFFAHHGNLDRLWAVWKTLPGGRRRDFTDPDWLNASFLFYDENARLVRVRVADALDPQQLGYSYQDTGNAWATARPSTFARAATSSVSVSPGSPPVASADVMDEIEEFGEAVSGKIKKLESVFRSKVKRPLKNKLKKLKNRSKFNIFGFGGGGSSGESQESRADELEEILVIQGVELDCNKASKFDVYINFPEADEKSSANVVEFVGTFVNVPHSSNSMKGHVKRTDVRLGISDTLEQLGVEDADNIVVTLVPRGVGKQAPVKFQGFKIEYE